MEAQFQSSFIPKKPIISGGEIKPARTKSLFAIIAIIIFVISLLLSGAVLFWERILTGQIEEDKKSLIRARDAFEPETIQTLVKISSRINSSKKLLASHTAISPIFELFENLTLKSVRFSSFDYSIKESGPTLTMKGQAQNFSAVALQAEVFGKSKFLKQPVLSDLAIDLDGRVLFTFTAGVSPELTAYKLKGSASPVPSSINSPSSNQ